MGKRLDRKERVMEELPQEVLARLDALAGAMGTSAEVLWAALVRGGLGIGITAAISFVLSLGLAFIAYRVMRAAHRAAPDAEVLWVIGLALTIISLVSVGVALSQMVYLFAPELYAANQVLEILR